MLKNYKKGFTLIELLVVIAIIGILSSVVLASLNSARNKGNNAKIKVQLSGLRAAAEIFYSNQSPTNSYNGSAGNILGSCTTINSMFVDPTSGMNQYTTSSNYPGSPTITCYSTVTAYAVSVPLSVSEGTSAHWCVDSTGNSKGEASAISGTVCP